MTYENLYFRKAREEFAAFCESVSGEDRLERLGADLIGAGAELTGPFGSKPLIYADYVASGRAVGALERFVLDRVLPFYANSHTQASHCGGVITGLREVARAAIARCCGAGEEHAVIFAGSGATSGLNRLVNLLGVRSAAAAGLRPRVVIGPYEHHSNILPWRESGAEVIEIPESASGGPDIDRLRAVLAAGEGRPLVCSFSAASNVTGIVTDVAEVTGIVKAAGGCMVWDYAGGGPYLPIAMCPAPGAEIDAIVLSPHKFVGGPGASGVLIVRRSAVKTAVPTWPGGGTVTFVTPNSHDYADRLEAREEAGTPNVIGDIRAALVFLIKEAIGQLTIDQRNAALTERALRRWKAIERMEMLGNLTCPRLPIFSFRVRDGGGGYIHHQLITRMLSDRYGIQARGGCACAGPYVHRLLEIDDSESSGIRAAVLDGDELRKPGFVRLNLSFLLSDRKADFILDSVARLASDAPDFVHMYTSDSARAVFYPRSARTNAEICS